MLKSLFTKPDDVKVNPNVVADIKRTISPGDKVGFFHKGELLGKGLVVALENNHILFEALTPMDALLEASQIGNIQRGIPWDFRIRSLEEIVEGKDHYIKCVMPGRININSRRDNFRVHIPVSSHYEVNFTLDDSHYNARILDLSCTGAQIRVASEGLSDIENQVIEEASIQLADELDCPVSFHIRWTETLPETIRIGIEFIDLGAAETDAIHRVVNEIERENIRKKKLLEKD